MDFLHRKTNLCFLSKRYAARMIENAAQKGRQPSAQAQDSNRPVGFFCFLNARDSALSRGLGNRGGNRLAHARIKCFGNDVVRRSFLI